MDPRVPGGVQRGAEEPNACRARDTLPISGLACGGGGALAIERALLAVPGIIRVYVSVATEMAYVEYRPAEVTRETLVDAIEKLGYETVHPKQ